MIDKKPKPEIYGIMAEFLSPEAVLAAARASYDQGYRNMDAYSPIPVEGLAEAVGFRRNYIALVVLIGGMIGAVGGYFMQWFSAVVHYPIIVGGRPLHSWPAFIPITFELTVLMAAFAAVFGMLGLNGLPRPHHPVFNVPGFALASRSRFFLCIQSKDQKFHRHETRLWLESQRPREVSEVPW
jgi:hypothetical protein